MNLNGFRKQRYRTADAIKDSPQSLDSLLRGLQSFERVDTRTDQQQGFSMRVQLKIRSTADDRIGTASNQLFNRMHAFNQGVALRQQLGQLFSELHGLPSLGNAVVKIGTAQ